MTSFRWSFALWLAFAATPVAAEEEPTTAFVFRLENQGQLRVPSEFSEVSVRAGGDGEVVFREVGGVKTARLKLAKRDFEALDALVAASRLVEGYLPTPRQNSRVHGTLRLERGGEWREFRVVAAGRTAELVQWFVRLANEARLLQRVERGESLYEVWAILDPRKRGPGGILHPESFRPPLTRLLARSEDIRDLRVIVAALSHVTTPEEWSRLLDQRLSSRNDRHVDILVEVIANHSVPGNSRLSHHEALLATLLRALRARYPDIPSLPQTRRAAAAAIISRLGVERHEPGIPVFADMIARYSTPENPWAMGALAAMGEPALDPLLALLRHPAPGVRMAAARTLALVLERNPRFPTSRGKTISPEQQAAILARLRKEAAPVLEKLETSDPEPHVRARAAAARERIERGWKR